MERIKVLLELIIQSAKIRRLEDVELCAQTLLGSIDKECTNELADMCYDFLEKKAIEKMMQEIN